MRSSTIETKVKLASTRRALLGGISAALAFPVAHAPTPASAAQNRSDLVLAPGDNHINHDLVVDGQLIVPPDSRLVIARGVTLTVRGDITASATQLFWGEGRVDLTRSKVLAARPEWWGARADDSSVDCEPALRACLDAHVAMTLGLGTYYISRTWTIDRPNRRIWGIGRTKDAFGTRIVLTRGGRGTVVRIGSERAPPSINEYLSGIDMRGIELGRSASAVEDPGDPATALSVRHVLDCRFEDLRANEHAIGYSLRGAVRTYLRDCRAFRSLASGSGRDSFIGFDLDGRDPPIQTGANASLYLIDCNVMIGTTLSTAIGVRMLGAMSDTFITRLETTTLAVGIHIEGGTGRVSSSPGTFWQIDVHIDTPVLDQCRSAGITIAGLGATSMIEVTSPYVSVAAAGTAAIAVSDCYGSIRIAGGQLVGSFAPGAAGLQFARCQGASASGTALTGFKRPVVASDTAGFELEILAIADSAANGPAISLDRCRRGYIRPRLSGVRGAYATAVAIDTASRGLSIETVGVDPAVLARGASAVTVAGRPIEPPPATSLIFIPSQP